MSFIYTSALEAFLMGRIDFVNDRIMAMLVDDSYSANDEHEFLIDVPSNARIGHHGGRTIGDAALLVEKSTKGGIARAADTTFMSIPPGKPINSVIVFQSTGTDRSSRLLCLVNSPKNFPIIPTGADIIVAWSKTDGVFALRQIR